MCYLLRLDDRGKIAAAPRCGTDAGVFSERTFWPFGSALLAPNDTPERARRFTCGPGAALKAEQTVGAEVRRSVFLRPGPASTFVFIRTELVSSLGPRVQ